MPGFLQKILGKLLQGFLQRIQYFFFLEISSAVPLEITRGVPSEIHVAIVSGFPPRFLELFQKLLKHFWSYWKNSWRNRKKQIPAGWTEAISLRTYLRRIPWKILENFWIPRGIPGHKLLNKLSLKEFLDKYLRKFLKKLP